MGHKQAVDAGENLLKAEEETNQSQVEKFGEGSDFEITLKLPRIIFKPISTKPDAHWLQQVAIATLRRYFYLTEDWSIEVDSERYSSLAGTIVIPEKTNGERFEFDGASVPIPWLVSLLTIGVLRPLGVLLIASLVHDYAFRYGFLQIRNRSGALENVIVERDQADDLFRDIVTVVNGNRAVGRLAWYFVRLGYWSGVKYNGQYRTGRPPYGVGISFVLAIAVLVILALKYTLLTLVLGALAVYLSLYVLTLQRLRAVSNSMALLLIIGILVGYVFLTFAD
ncbi:MAG: DUF1353 domain-containing protein [Congregibacter sp.]